MKVKLARTLTVETVKNIGSSSLLAQENLHANHGSALGDTVGTASNGTSAVSSVTHSVGSRAGDGAVAVGRTSAELSVGGVDARVDHIGECAGAGRSVVDVVRGASSSTAGDGSKAPGRAGLGGERVQLPHLILLNGDNLG